MSYKLQINNHVPFWQIVVLALFSYIAFIYGISTYPIADMNEGLYAEIAREMLVLHDAVIPHLNFVPYLEKPPLLYWLISLSYKIFGISTFAARIIPGLSALVVTTCLTLFCKKLSKDHICTKINTNMGWIAGIILASSAGYILIAHIVFFDLLLTAILTITICCFYLWYTYGNKKFLWSAYFALALAFLTKGLIAITLTFLIVITFMLLVKTSRRKLIQLFDPIGIGIFLLVIAPWHILAAIKLPSFWQDYFINEQLGRFLNKRIPHDYHTGPIYFYLPRICVYIFPWILLVPTMLYKKFITPSNSITCNNFTTFLWVWFLTPLWLFSLSGAKGDYYMVLGMPPLAMLIAQTITTYIANNNFKTLFYCFCFTALTLIACSIMVIICNIIPAAVQPTFKNLVLLLICFAIIGFCLLRYYQTPLLSFLFIGGLMLPLPITYISFEKQMQSNYNQLAITNYIQAHNKNQQVFLFKDYERLSTTLLFLAKPIPIIESSSQDLFYGSKHPSVHGMFITKDEFKKVMYHNAVYVITHKDNLQLLQTMFAPQNFYILTTSYKAVLLTNK